MKTRPLLRAFDRQIGAALLLVMAIVAVGASYMLLRAFNGSNANLERDSQAYLVLREAKQALINYAIRPEGSFLGELPYPDITDTQDLVEAATPNYDGLQDRHCPDTSSSVRPAIAVLSRCFGRLPWKTLGMALPHTTENDPDGEMPWYAVSANLLDPCVANLLNPLFLNRTYWVVTHNCLTASLLPNPWLTVRDKYGNVLSNRVAFVLIMPGQRINTQVRPTTIAPGTALPRNFLDAVTVSPACKMPCVPGTYDNAGFSPGNDFIIGEDRTKVSGSDTNFSQPYVFNDKVIYVTIDELMEALEKRALQEAKRQLQLFYGTKTYYPYAANVGDSTGTCVNNNRRGFLPLAVGTCPAGDYLPAANFPTWFTNANWQNFIYYTPACAKVKPPLSCVGAGMLTVGGRGNIEALLIGTGRPIANANSQMPNMVTPPFAASLTRDQTGCCSAAIVDYLDSSINTDGNDVYDAQGIPATVLYNDQALVVAP